MVNSSIENEGNKTPKNLKEAFDNMLEGCQIINRNWQYLYLNKAAAIQGRRKKEELLGRTMMEMYPGIEKTELFIYLKRCMNERTAHMMENEFEFPDGKKGWFELRIEPVPEGIFILSIDITARKFAEKTLRESEEKYKILVENIPDITWIADQEGNVIFISPHVQEIMGFTPEEIYKGGIQMTFGQIHPDDLERAHKEYELLFRENREINSEIRFRKKDGSWAWLYLRSLSSYEKNGVRYSIGLFSDISQKKETENKIKELNELKSRFLRIINHQMRTPLTSIRWNLESLLSGNLGEIKDIQKEILKMIYDADLEIIRRINDLLIAMDIEEGRLTLSKTPCFIDTLIKSVIIEWQRVIMVKDIQLKMEIPDSLPSIEIDGDKIRDVISKLLGNAITYTNQNGEIKLKISLDGKSVRLEIIDNGIGIPQQEQSHIFTKFYRASNASLMKSDATGMALYIAKSIIEIHGGKIGFSSVEGRGSAFWFELPINN